MTFGHSALLSNLSASCGFSLRGRRHVRVQNHARARNRLKAGLRLLNKALFYIGTMPLGKFELKNGQPTSL